MLFAVLLLSVFLKNLFFTWFGLTFWFCALWGINYFIKSKWLASKSTITNYAILLIILLIGISLSSFKSKNPYYSVTEVYAGTPLSEQAKAITDDGLKDVQVILSPLKLNNGSYSIKVTRFVSDFYKVDGKGVYIETSFCFVYAYSKQALLEIDSQYGVYKGKLTFIDP